MKRLKTNKFNSIKLNMMVYSISMIAIIVFLSILSFTFLNQYKGNIDVMFKRHIVLATIADDLESMDINLLGFLTSKSSTKLNDFMVTQGKLDLKIEKLEFDSSTIEGLMIENIANLVDSYKTSGTKAIAYKRQRNVTMYYKSYKQSNMIKNYVLTYIEKLNAKQLSQNSIFYTSLINQIHWMQIIAFVIVMSLIILVFVIAFLITARMVRPINRLSYAAEEISKGNFETEDVYVQSEDEWLLLANTFNKMKNSISIYIEEIQTQGEMENILKDEQLKNIKMAHLLDSARLYALQSQINPHFLFNTLNAGVQMSVLEGAPKTSEFLDTMSNLFRYNIQKMESTCTLREEINNIHDYYNLLNVRFGKRILFEFEIDENSLDIKVPPLILQPLVENAYIHGLSHQEKGGLIKIRTYQTILNTYIEIKDTGRGMSEKTIARLLSKEPDSEDEQYGIGIRNVRDRLELYFHKEGLFKIESLNHIGVTITIELPRMETDYV